MIAFSRIYLYIQTIFKLGILNVAYVAWYRFTLKSGIRTYFFPKRKFHITDDVFLKCQVRSNYPSIWKNRLLEDADKITNGEIRYYAYHWKNIGNPPNWFLNPFNNHIYPKIQNHWSRLPDFLPEVGDIKNIWEASRFEWVNTLSRAFAVTGKTEYIETLNNWINDWAENNPLNEGPNWKCGQEASIRVFNLINTALILDQDDKPSKVLCDLIYAHLERINSNILYAIAQDNNHGISEATALFIGGNWLNSNSNIYPKASQFATKGRKWIENRIKELVEDDGGFSQHSITYQRVLLDTLIFAEFWRQKLELPAFSDIFYSKANAAINWLWILTDEKSGNCPNLGSNDGALFLNMHSCEYRDFRPSLQTASVLFSNKKYFDGGIWDEPLYWFEKLNVHFENKYKKKVSEVLNSGYVVMKSPLSWCLLRFPHFRFRPSHNDVFHFDLWYKGENIIQDSGTYSYNSPISEKFVDYKSVHSHNTVSFDNKEQMTVLGRFLLGNWITPDSISPISNNNDNLQIWEGQYSDSRSNSHKRKITQTENSWIIEDILSGNFKTATIGFNLRADKLSIENNIIKMTWGEINFSANTKFEIHQNFISDYYWETHSSNRLIIQIDKAQSFVTTIKLNS